MSLGFVPRIAKTPDPLIERADKVIEDVATLHVKVITKADLRELRRYQTAVRRR